MQLRAALFCAALLASAQPASAVCILIAGGAGQLDEPRQATGYTEMSSDVGDGRATSFTVTVALGSSTITVDPPTVTYLGTTPHSGDMPLIRYRAVDVLGTIRKDQPLTNQQSSFNVTSLLGLVTTTVNGKVTNNAGFAEGQYQLKTVVTCS